MSIALRCVEQIRSELKPIEQRILEHRYLRALEQGRLQREQLKVFAGQQHHIISSDLRSIALILSRHGTLASRRFLMNALQGEAAALDALHAFAGALGLAGGDPRWLAGRFLLPPRQSFESLIQPRWNRVARSVSSVGGDPMPTG